MKKKEARAHTSHGMDSVLFMDKMVAEMSDRIHEMDPDFAYRDKKKKPCLRSLFDYLLEAFRTLKIENQHMDNEIRDLQLQNEHVLDENHRLTETVQQQQGSLAAMSIDS
jgi:hypothetical protein